MSDRSDPAAPPLQHLSVLDLTTDLGALAPRFLAGFGAHVTRIEAPGGDPLRRKPPIVTGHDGQDVSLYWLQMMTGRECLELDLESDRGRQALRELLGSVDIVIESQPLGALERLGLGYDDVRPTCPQLIWTSITPFGRYGPRARWQGTDLIGFAAGGLMSLCGDPDRPPLRISVEQGYGMAGAVAVTGTLAAIHARWMTGEGQLVDVSMQEAISNCLGNSRMYYEFEGLISRRAGGARAYGTVGARLVYPCADGHVALSRTAEMMEPLHCWLRESGMVPGWDAAEWALLPQSGPGTPGPEKSRELEDDLVAFFSTQRKMDLYEEGQTRGVLICPVATPADLLANRQLQSRDFFVDRSVLELGRSIKAPTAPVRFSRTPWRLDDAPPRSRPAREPVTPRNALSRDSRAILAGTRIADFSWVGVGPITTQLLAGLGAEVIRVESETRLDNLRVSGPFRGPSPVDGSAYFANFNRDKLGITLNLAVPEARAIAKRLVERADIVVEAFRPGFMRSIGLAYDDLRAINPSVIMMSCSMEGATGPHAGFRGFGLTLQSTAGFTHFTGWPDRAPVGTGTAYTDWFATNVAAASLMAAMEHRRRTGGGQYIDLSQLEACVWALEAEVLRYTATGELRPALGNRHLEMAPHGVFPTTGDDRWIAIAVRDTQDWRALARLVGNATLLDARFDDVAIRRAEEDAIEAILETWTATHDRDALVLLLQDAGSAYAVNDMADVQADPQLRARGHFWRIAHPTIGPVDWDAPAFRLADTPLSPGRPAPCLGEHNDHVYRELLGLTTEELTALLVNDALR